MAVSREVAKHARLPRARRAALAMIDLRTMIGHITNGRRLSFGARPWCGVRAVTSKCSRHSRGTRVSATSVAVSREVAKHASLPRARRAAPVVIRPRTTERHITGEGPLYIGARPSRDVRAVTSKCSWYSRGTRAIATAVAVTQEMAKYATLPHARRAALVVICLRTTGEPPFTSGRPLSFGARPWCERDL